MMYGRPSRVSLRPDYLTGYMEADAPMSSMGPAPMAPMAPMGTESAPLLMEDRMTVSAMPMEGKKDSNYARLFGVSLLVLGLGLAMRRR